MGKTYRRSRSDWDDDYHVDYHDNMKKDRKADKYARADRHRKDEIIEMNERVDDKERAEK